MPTTYHEPRVRLPSSSQPTLPNNDDTAHGTEHIPSTTVCHETENVIATLHRTITGRSHAHDDESDSDAQSQSGSFAKFEEYLREDQGKGPEAIPVSVCFKNVSTYGRKSGDVPVKTVWDAIRRTLMLQDIYESMLKKIVSPEKIEHGRALIRDFTGVVKSGEMMLVLGNPGSGCSTFLRTIGNDHASFLGVKGSIDYSGLSPEQVRKSCRGLVSYVEEDDVHLPTLTVRQTLEFALCNKTPKRWLSEVPRFLEVFGQVFGMTHVMDTLVGNEYIRGVSGGERKRVSILESLASDSSVNAWDGSTRGLDASSAVDYVRSLRILTDACKRATIVSIYQASDAIYEMMDKVMLIDEGRMLYQGPACQAEAYFNSLGYQRLQRQTMSDFLTSIPLAVPESIMVGFETRVPRGAANLEQAFRSSPSFKLVEQEVASHGADFANHDIISPQPDKSSHAQALKRKSRFVSPKSSYNTSFPRQVVLCAKRELWQLSGHKLPFLTKLACVIICALLLGSMFYQMPSNTDGVYSRGGFSFYSSALVAWFQMAELETAFYDREVVSRQKRYAAVRPAAVVAGKVLVDMITVSIMCFIYAVLSYFLAGMRYDVGAFFGYAFATFFAAMAYTAFYRVFGAASPRIEIALRYCGLLLLVAMVCGGYVRSVDKLMADAPWVGWLAYTTPVLYTYEIIMALEFHGRVFTCAQDSIIPSGAAYNDPAFQSCASKGVAPGQLGLDGDNYIATQFGFSYSNVGRNFGILILFIVVLLAINMWLVEYVDWADGSGAGLEFSKIAASQKKAKSGSADEENVSISPPAENASRHADRTETDSDASKGLQKSKSTFTWQDINYTIPHKGGEKKLLNGVSGYCEPGSLTALVGASGAGKSTLMTVFTQQATGRVAGTMAIDGHPIDASFGREIGYCQQMDIHVETSTVREAFEFSALLRQSATTPRAEKLAYVDSVIDILGMTDLQDAIIRSLSLEQKKRTTIGVELCAKPSLLLFLDEPTSGLDSLGAMNIVRLLRRLADAGQAIICTIHQASQEQFELFDRVLALNRGGNVYYFGDIGPRGVTVLDYFKQHGVESEADKNVADLLIEVTARNSKSSKQKDWCNVWAHSPEAAAVLNKINTISRTSTTSNILNTTGRDTGYASSTKTQTLLLTRRTLTQYWRTPDYIYSRLYCSFFHALLNGLAFLQLSHSAAAMQYRIFSCFLVLMIVPEFINACALMFIDNRNVWLGRELPSRVYGWKAFTTAQIVSEVPFALAGGVVFYMLFYFLVGFPLGMPAGYTFLMMMMFHLFATSWGQWIAALSTDAVMAASIMPFFVIMCEFFNGVLQPQALMPAVWAYTMYYIGPFTYWIRGILAVILPGLTVRCLESELIRFSVPEGMTCGEYAGDWISRADIAGYVADPGRVGECGYCQYAVGDEFLSLINLDKNDAWPFLGIFALFMTTNYVCVYLFVYVKSVRNWLPW